MASSVSSADRKVRAGSPPPSRVRLVCCAAVLGLGFPLAASVQALAACTKPSEGTIAGQFDRWNQALASRDPDAVANLYAENAVLRVAGQPSPIIGRPAIRDYFAGFLVRRPQGALSRRSISVSCNAASDTGNYVYRLSGQRKGTRTLISGRYSTFYEYRNGDWFIVRQQG